MPVLRFFAYDEEDINGTTLGEVTEASEKSVLVQHNGVGAGEFAISRHSSQRTLCRPGRYLRAQLDSGSPFFGFFVSESRNTVLSPQEQGAEVFRRAGEGPISILSDAIVWYEAVTTNDSAVPRGDDEFWHWPGPVNAAGIMVRMLEEAQDRGCFPDLTYDFSRTLDSNGDAWTIEAEDFQLPIGMDLLTVAGLLQQVGLVFVMSHDFVLSCYESATYGTDLSATVTLEKGVNIATGVEQTVIAAPARSTTLVRGQRGDNGETAWVEVDSVAGLAEVKRRKEGFLYAGSTTGFDTLQSMGEESIYQKLRLRAGPTAIGVYDTGTAPFTDYFPGDVVTVDVPNVWEAEARQITYIGISETEGGEADVVVGFDQGPSIQSKGAALSPPPTIPSVQGCSDCPPDPPFIPPEPCNILADAVLTIGSGSFLGEATDRIIHYGSQVGVTPFALVNGHQYRVIYQVVSNIDLTTPPIGYENVNGPEFGGKVGVEGVDGVWSAPDYGWSAAPTDTTDVDYNGANIALLDNPPVGTRADGMLDPGFVFTGGWATYSGDPGVVDVYLGGTFKSGFGGYLLTVRVQIESRQGDGSALVCAGSTGPSSPNYAQPVGEQATDLPTAGVYTTNFPYIPGSLRVHVGGVLVNVIEVDPAAGEWSFAGGFDPGSATIVVDYLAASGTATGGTNAQPTPGTSHIPDDLIPPSAGGGLPWFDVTDYGATGDGTTDDTADINTAIAALNSADRGVLYFPAGAYKTTAALTAISAGQAIIRGDGSASFDYTEWGTSIINTSATAVLFTINSKIARFESLGLLSNSGGTPSAGTAILVDSAYLEQRCDFHDIHVRGFYDGIDSKVNAQWSMSDSIITAPVRYGMRLRNTVNPDAGDGSIVNSNFYADAYNATSAIRHESGGGLKLSNVKVNMALSGHRFATGYDAVFASVTTSVNTINSCSFENLSGDAISIAVTGTGVYNMVSISGCQIALYTNNTGRAVKIAAANAGGIVSGGFAGAVIDGCTLRTDGTARAAIELTNTDKVTLGDNVLLENFTSLYTSSGDTNTVVGSGVPNAEDVPITDTGGYFTGTDVEAALQELGADVATAVAGHWEVVVSGTAPPVAVSNPADDDWVYAFVAD